MCSVRRINGRRAVSLLLALLLIIMALPMTARAEEIVAVTTAAVNLRKGAGTDAPAKQTVAAGTTVTVTDTSHDGWYGVTLADGTKGYISSAYVQASAEIPAKTNAYVNLRSGAGTDYGALRIVREGTELTVTNTDNSEWYAVRLQDGTTGYIYAVYLDLGDVQSTPTKKPGTTQKPDSDTIATAVTTAAVNLRSGPATSKNSQGVLAAGTAVTVTEKTSSEWYAVTLENGKKGYIYSKYLREDAAASTGETAGATTTYVNLRSGAGTSYYSKGTLKAGTELTVTDRSDLQWYAVKLPDGRTGYVYSIYVEIAQEGEEAAPKPTAKPTAAPTPEATAKPAGEVVMKTTAAVNLRKGPATSYDRILVVEKGTEVTVTSAAQDGWYKVRLADGTAGYLTEDYLKLVSGDPDSLTEEDGSGNAGDSVSPDGEVTEVIPEKTEYVSTTVSDLNLRSGAGTEYSRVQSMKLGTVLEVLSRTSNGWIKVRLTDGTEGYVSSKYTAAYDPSSADAELPEGGVSMAQYMTLYLDADVSGTVYWSSSNTSVARVDTGSGSQVFVYGVKPGTADVIAKNASGKILTTKTVTVTDPEPVRFAYTTPNVISAGESFDFAAITDSGKTSVKFEIEGLKTYKTNRYTEESNGDNRVRVFTRTVTINEPGAYTVRAYANSGSGYSKKYREFEILVVSTKDKTTTSNESRRISDQMLDAVAQFEGYRPEVYADTLAGNIPTVGYGYVVEKNTTFYNFLTETEAWAMLADTLNRRGYTTQLNTFIDKNDIKMNQQQFDALVSFSYNVGSGYWNSTTKCYLRTILKDNTFAMPKDLSEKNPLSGKVAAEEITLYADHGGGSAAVKTLKADKKVKIVGYYRNNDTAEAWYRVIVGDDEGWVRSGNITLTSTKGLVRDLAYVDAYTFCSNLLDWHRAGGRCVKGLQTRRLAEAKVFSHGNYEEAVKSSKNYKKNTYGYELPDCM